MDLLPRLTATIARDTKRERGRFIKWFGLDQTASNELSMEDLVRDQKVVAFFDFFDNLNVRLQFGESIDNAAGTSEYPNIGECALQKLVELYMFSRDESEMLVLRDLGNGSDDYSEDACVDFLLASHALIDNANQYVLRTVSRTMYKFCAFLDPKFTKKGLVFSIIRRLLMSKDEVVLCDALGALAFTYDTSDNLLVYGIDLCCMLNDPVVRPSSVLIPLLFTVGKMVSGSAKKSLYDVQQMLLPKLRELLIKGDDDRIKKLCCFIISTVTSHGSEHSQAVIDAHLLRPLFDLLGRDINYKDDALLAIVNCTTNTSDKQFMGLLDESCIKSLCDLLRSDDAIIVGRSLDVIHEILDCGEKSPYRNIMEDAGCFGRLKRLKFYENKSISRKADRLIRKFWIGDDYLGILPENFRKL